MTELGRETVEQFNRDAERFLAHERAAGRVVVVLITCYPDGSIPGIAFPDGAPPEEIAVLLRDVALTVETCKPLPALPPRRERSSKGKGCA